MRRSFYVLAGGLLSILIFFSGCAKYSDAKSVLKDQAKILETYVADMEAASSADELVEAINTFTRDMTDMLPKLQEISKKYPQLQDKEEIPEELREEFERLSGLSEKMAAAAMKNIQYMGDPKVQEALKSQGEVMQNTLD